MLASSGKENDSNVAQQLYNELPESSFTRSISNPELVMRKRRQLKLEKKLQQIRSNDGGPDTGKWHVEQCVQLTSRSFAFHGVVRKHRAVDHCEQKKVLHISQGSVATCLRYDGIFNYHDSSNLLWVSTIKKCWNQSAFAKIWALYSSTFLPHISKWPSFCIIL